MSNDLFFGHGLVSLTLDGMVWVVMIKLITDCPTPEASQAAITPQWRDKGTSGGSTIAISSRPQRMCDRQVTDRFDKMIVS